METPSFEKNNTSFVGNHSMNIHTMFGLTFVDSSEN